MEEKHQAFEKVEKQGMEIGRLQQELSAYAEKYQTLLTQEHELQAQSEKRWAQLIDQARQETSVLRKNYEQAAVKNKEKMECLQNNLLTLQGKLTALQMTINHKETVIVELNQQLKQSQKQYTEALSKIAVVRGSIMAKVKEKRTKTKRIKAEA